jgi:hypothetical protein
MAQGDYGMGHGSQIQGQQKLDKQRLWRLDEAEGNDDDGIDNKKGDKKTPKGENKYPSPSGKKKGVRAGADDAIQEESSQDQAEDGVLGNKSKSSRGKPPKTLEIAQDTAENVETVGDSVDSEAKSPEVNDVQLSDRDGSIGDSNTKQKKAKKAETEDLQQPETPKYVRQERERLGLSKEGAIVNDEEGLPVDTGSSDLPLGKEYLKTCISADTLQQAKGPLSTQSRRLPHSHLSQEMLGSLLKVTAAWMCWPSNLLHQCRLDRLLNQAQIGMRFPTTSLLMGNSRGTDPEVRAGSSVDMANTTISKLQRQKRGPSRSASSSSNLKRQGSSKVNKPDWILLLQVSVSCTAEVGNFLAEFA